MKKFFVLFIAFAVMLGSVSAQELEEQSVVNTAWTGIGLPEGEGFRWTGIIDTVQARVDVWHFTFDGMLSWGALTNWKGNTFGSFAFENTDRQQFKFLDENRNSKSYYLNFIWHAFDGFDAGMGTQLDWAVGPAPYTDGFAWEAKAHVEQGDLKPGAPAFNNVAGYMTYGNTYAWTAIAARYKYKNIFEVGIAVPDYRDYGQFTLNLGAEVKPLDWLKIAAAYENLCQRGGNLYTGVTFNFKDNFIIDAWFGLDGIGLADGRPEKMLGTGAAIFIKFGKLPLWIRPEAGFSKYLKSDYTLAFYTGGRVQWDITEALHLGGFFSLAWGARDKKWASEYDGGFIWNVRPDFTFDINKEHSVAATFEYEAIRYPDDSAGHKFLIGFFWRFNKAF